MVQSKEECSLLLGRVFGFEDHCFDRHLCAAWRDSYMLCSAVECHDILYM